jgi:hypothetical protein
MVVLIEQVHPLHTQPIRVEGARANHLGIHRVFGFAPYPHPDCIRLGYGWSDPCRAKGAAPRGGGGGG